ncbi:MAG: hypothetical protein KDA27_12175 [Candidatus Eisenbacteria bacterium]|uniref:Heavy metal binding domain-containing protein n=1 Tax=Eiseniibacteriota bacterium TaxID=2212470 RepID=A0A956ND17_UNCEI|nr:hypothetical protein [Candidatus Eisenbacteria bacterium]
MTTPTRVVPPRGEQGNRIRTLVWIVVASTGLFLLADPLNLHSLDDHIYRWFGIETHAHHLSGTPGVSAAGEELASTWTCPMHPQIRGTEPGTCRICEMDLVPVNVAVSDTGGVQSGAKGEQK